jgi:hypothetical protein
MAALYTKMILIYMALLILYLLMATPPSVVIACSIIYWGTAAYAMYTYKKSSKRS